MGNNFNSLMIVGKLTRFFWSLFTFNFFFGWILFGFVRWIMFGGILLGLLMIPMLLGKNIIFKSAQSRPEQPYQHRRNKTTSDIIDVEAEVVDE
ncbi:MAG: hypothetical protein ABII88_05330 [Candidatus Omnitrophota bacterium]